MFRDFLLGNFSKKSSSVQMDGGCNPEPKSHTSPTHTREQVANYSIMDDLESSPPQDCGGCFVPYILFHFGESETFGDTIILISLTRRNVFVLIIMASFN